MKNLLLVVLLGLLIGCGGGGGGSDSEPTPFFSIESPELRMYQPGDRITYSGYYVGQYSDGSGRVDENGTAYLTYAAGDNGEMVESYSFGGQNETVRVGQDETGMYAYLPLGHEDATWVLLLPPTFSVGQSWNQVDWDGTTFGNYAVVSRENIETAAGTFEAYRVEYSTEVRERFVRTDYESGTLWVYPQIGVVKREAIITSSSEYRAETSFEVVSASFFQ